MSSYEVVRRAVEFDRPDRLPLRFDALGLSDVKGAGWNQIGTAITACPRLWMSGAVCGCAPK